MRVVDNYIGLLLNLDLAIMNEASQSAFAKKKVDVRVIFDDNNPIEMTFDEFWDAVSNYYLLHKKIEDRDDVLNDLRKIIVENKKGYNTDEDTINKIFDYLFDE